MAVRPRYYCGLSRFDRLNRHVGMKRKRDRIWLIAIVVAHLAISIVHGQAHAGAQVPLSRAANLFVFAVILAGPLIGVVLMLLTAAVGSWVVAVTMTASLVFGVVNHFMLVSPDHVSHVDPAWRVMFATTAVLLAVTEAAGSLFAFRVARERTGP